MPLPDCILQDRGKVSRAFLAKGVTTFADACHYVKSIPYGRNENKEDTFCVFDDNCGTCGTKHALLKRLADENDLEGFVLVTGIYRMDNSNTPGIGSVLQDHQLEYIPEAHNYFKAGDESFDFTFPYAKTLGFECEVLEETVIQPHQITDYKVGLHKNFMSRWLLANKNINLSLGKLWEIRELCIANLSLNKK
jgi:hypothetical protein